MNKNTIEYLQNSLHNFYSSFARDLPWRKNKDPYSIWVSEIMLQQTQVKTVIPYFERFLKLLPDVSHLAKIDIESLMKLWEGLGYYSRVKHMHQAAKIIVNEYHGILPKTALELLKLPGIGLYTAGAIASIAYEERIAAVDGNVHRVLSRYLGLPITKEELLPLMDELLPSQSIGNFNQALMEVGSRICIPQSLPLCNECPINQKCQAFKKQLTDSLPIKPKKLNRTIEDKTLLIITDQTHYVIRKRPSKGLLANLWEFPLLEGSQTINEISAFLLDLGIDEFDLKVLPNSVHTFTHKDWKINAYKITTMKLNPVDHYTLVSRFDLNQIYTLSSLFKKYQEYYQ